VRDKLIKKFLERATAYSICLARYMLSTVRPSVTRVDYAKTVEVRIMNFHHTVAPCL